MITGQERRSTPWSDKDSGGICTVDKISRSIDNISNKRIFRALSRQRFGVLDFGEKESALLLLVVVVVVTATTVASSTVVVVEE